MKYLHVFTLSAAMSAALIFGAFRAHAEPRMVGGVPRNNFSGHSNNFSWERGHGFKHGFGGVWVVEREVPVYVEVPVAAPPVTPAPEQAQVEKRKPYVIGASYDSLPGGCMKLIEEGVSYYYCSGDWYRQAGWGRSATYKAVARP